MLAVQTGSIPVGMSSILDRSVDDEHADDGGPMRRLPPSRLRIRAVPVTDRIRLRTDGPVNNESPDERRRRNEADLVGWYDGVRNGGGGTTNRPASTVNIDSMDPTANGDPFKNHYSNPVVNPTILDNRQRLFAESVPLRNTYSLPTFLDDIDANRLPTNRRIIAAAEPITYSNIPEPPYRQPFAVRPSDFMVDGGPAARFLSIPNDLSMRRSPPLSAKLKTMFEDAAVTAELERDLEQTRLRFAAEMARLDMLRNSLSAAVSSSASPIRTVGRHNCTVCGAACGNHNNNTDQLHSSAVESSLSPARAESKSWRSPPPIDSVGNNAAVDPNRLATNTAVDANRLPTNNNTTAIIVDANRKTDVPANNNTTNRAAAKPVLSADVGTTDSKADMPETLLDELGLSTTIDKKTIETADEDDEDNADDDDDTEPTPVDKSDDWTTVRRSLRSTAADRSTERQITQACWQQRSCVDANCGRIHGEFEPNQDTHYKSLRAAANDSSSVTHSFGHLVCPHALLRSGCRAKGICKYRHFMPNTLRRLTEMQRSALAKRAAIPSGPHSC